MRWVLWSAFSPSQVLVYLVILGALLLVGGRTRLGRGLCVLGGRGLLLFGLLPLSHYLLAPLEDRFPQPRLPAQVTGILLLAGAGQPAETEAHGEPWLNGHGPKIPSTAPSMPGCCCGSRAAKPGWRCDGRGFSR